MLPLHRGPDKHQTLVDTGNSALNQNQLFFSVHLYHPLAQNRNLFAAHAARQFYILESLMRIGGLTGGTRLTVELGTVGLASAAKP